MVIMGHKFMLKYGIDEMKENVALDHYANGVSFTFKPSETYRFMNTFVLYPEHIKRKILSTEEAESFRNLYKAWGSNEP